MYGSVCFPFVDMLLANLHCFETHGASKLKKKLKVLSSTVLSVILPPNFL